MATLYTQQSKNVAKTWALMATFLIFVILIGWSLSWYYGDPLILYIAVAFSIFMNIWGYWFSDKTVIKLTGAKPASKEEYWDLYTVTENLAITAGLPMPKLYVIDDPVPNAFATGRDKEHAVVAATTGLLKMLDRSELEGVIAHELSHIGNKDMLVSTVAVVLVGFVVMLSDIFLRSGHFGGRNDSGRAGAIIVIVGIVLAILAPIFAQLIQLGISRKRELLADASGALLTRYPEGLANALRKISGVAQPMRKANNATAHLFFSNPFGPNKKQIGWFARLFMTHPPIEERIAALVGMR